jgi:hypothetical protein
LVVFLSEESRVDIFVDGHLVESETFEAGNHLLDTANLPDGSYPVLLQVHSLNGSVHEERRFFAKSSNVPPVGQKIYFAYAGLLANTHRGRPLSVSKTLFYQLGTARRLSNHFALDVSVIGTSRRPVIEAGAWFINSIARVRLAAIASTRGDRGGLLQVSAGDTGRLALNFDLRSVWSVDGRPLLPFTQYIDTFDSIPPEDRISQVGSFTQASGSIGYRLGAAYVSVIGSLRKDRGPMDYSIGPSVSWPIIARNGLQLALEANGQLTRITTSGFLGFRLFYASNRFSASASGGQRAISSNASLDHLQSGPVADANAQYSLSDQSGDAIELGAGITRDVESTFARLAGDVSGPAGIARGQITHDFSNGGGTHYTFSAQTGVVANTDGVAIGGRDLAESALIVSIDGSDDSEFEVFVDNRPRGRLRSGRPLPIFLVPYRSYSVKIRPVTATSVSFDTAARTFTLYPGTVEHFRWRAEHLATVYGRALRPDGTAVANAFVTSEHGIGESNAAGEFQIEVAASDELSFRTENGAACAAALPPFDSNRDFLSLGKVLCR